MLEYRVLVSDTFKEKFEVFLDNLNKINPRVISVKEVVAIPKREVVNG